MDLGRRLADALRKLQDEHGLDQKQLARRLRMSHATVHRLVRGDRGTTLRTIEHLCTIMRCSPNDLFEPGKLRLPIRRTPRSG